MDVGERVRMREVDTPELVALVRQAQAAGRDPDPPAPDEVRVWSVLTVDVLDGRIQAVRFMRNPDKLRHL